MHAAQLVACHHASMECYRRAEITFRATPLKSHLNQPLTPFEMASKQLSPQSVRAIAVLQSPPGVLFLFDGVRRSEKRMIDLDIILGHSCR